MSHIFLYVMFGGNGMIDELNAISQSLVSDLPYLIRIVLAAVCGAAIGLERTYRQKEAGIRTHIIVCLSSALMMIISKYAFSDIVGVMPNVSLDASRIAANIITGVSFLGSGIIIFKGSIKGLTTAAGVWATSGIGLACGSGMYGIAIYGTLLLLVIQIAIHKFLPIENQVMTTITMKLKPDPESVTSVQKTLNKLGLDLLSSTVEKEAEYFTCIFNVRAKTHKVLEKLEGILDENEDVISISM